MLDTLLAIDLQFAFPDDVNVPTESDQFGSGTGISRLVLLELECPEFGARPRHSGVSTTFVTVPEAAVHEDRGVELRKDNIRLSGEIASVQAESVATLVEPASDDQFGLGILAPDPCHHASACFAIDDVVQFRVPLESATIELHGVQTPGNLQQ